MYKNFVLDCLEEGLFIDEIDDYVEYWHTNEMNISLCEFLGFTEEEYRDWLIYGNDVVRDILYCRRHTINYNDYINMSTGDKIAARSYNLEEVKKYKKDGE